MSIIRFRIYLLTVCVLLNGCASSIKAFYDRAVVEDSINDSITTVSLSADRRTVLVKTSGVFDGRFCAEPPPDVAQNFKSALKATLEGSGPEASGIKGKAAVDDNLDTQAVVLAERTVLLDVFRTGTYALCQYYMNGAMTGPELKQSFDNLVTGVLDRVPIATAKAHVKDAAGVVQQSAAPDSASLGR